MVGTDRGEVRLSSWSRAGVGICQDHVRRRPALYTLETLESGEVVRPCQGPFSGVTSGVHYMHHLQMLSRSFLRVPRILAAQEGGRLPRRRSYPAPVSEKLIGQRLREIRNQRGMLQKELAAKLGMDQSVLSRYERGELRLPGSLIASIAKTLKTSVDEILGTQGIKRDRITTDRRFIRRLRLIDALPTRKKQALLTTLDEFLKGASAMAD